MHMVSYIHMVHMPVSALRVARERDSEWGYACSRCMPMQGMRPLPCVPLFPGIAPAKYSSIMNYLQLQHCHRVGTP